MIQPKNLIQIYYKTIIAFEKGLFFEDLYFDNGLILFIFIFINYILIIYHYMIKLPKY